MKSLSIAIVGGETLAGKEVREVFRQRGLAWQIHLIGADEEETGRITEEGDEAAIITSLDGANLAAADVVVLAGSKAASRKAYELMRVATPKKPLIDVTRTLEDLPSARLCAPGAGVQPAGFPAIIANPAAIALASFHKLVNAVAPVRRWLAEMFEPASEQGQSGIDELHQQTIRLFSFQSLPQAVYDTQVAFAMLPRYGEESPHSIERAEQTIERHLASLLAAYSAKMPSLRLLHAPVFHGYMISVWVEFDVDTSVEALQTHMRSQGIDVRTKDEEPPSNPGVAGQDGLIIGDIRVDRNVPRAFWFWIAADNLRLPALNAARVVEAVCGGK